MYYSFAVRAVVFIFGVILFLIISFLIFNFLKQPFDNILNLKDTSITVLSTGSWFYLFLILVIPRLLYSLIFSGLVVILYYVMILKKHNIDKKFFLFLLILGTVFLILIFPKKVISVGIAGIPSPPSTYEVEYRYREGYGFDSSPSEQRDAATIIFRTNTSIDQIASFYKSKGVFEEEDFKSRNIDINNLPENNSVQLTVNSL